MFSNVVSSGQSEWELLSVTQSSELGSEERVSVKKVLREQKKQAEKGAQIAEMRRLVTVQQAAYQDVVLEKRVKQAEARADDLQKKLDEERRECERLAVQLEERDRVLLQATEKAQQEVQQEREKVKMAEERVQQVEARNDDLQRRLDAVEGRVEEEFIIQQQPITAEKRTG